MVTDGYAQGMGGGHVKDLRNCHRSSTDLLRTATDRFSDEKIAQRIGLMTVLIREPCQQIRQCFYGYFLPRKRQGCKGCHKDIQDGYTDNKDTH